LWICTCKLFQPDITRKLHFSWMDLAAPIGIGGLWLSAFLRQLESRPVLPVRDPHFAEAFGKWTLSTDTSTNSCGDSPRN
jgi:hypothetical protein